MRKKWMKFMAVALSAGLALSLAACGSNDNADTVQEESVVSVDTEISEDTETESVSAGALPDEIAEALDAVTGDPEFYAEEFGSVDVSVLAGKKVMLVAYDSTNDWCVNYVLMAQAVLDKIGAEAEITYCDGTTDSWIQAIQNAVNQGYDAIDLFGISDIGQLDSAIEEAKAAGVYVQDTHGTDISDTSSNTDVSIGCDYERAGELMAMEAIREVGGTEEINCLVVADVGWGADASVAEGIANVFDEYDCSYTVAEVAITDWTEGIGDAVRNAFIADSTYNAVIAYYDNMCLYVVPVLEELGMDLDEIVVGSFNGNVGLIDYVSDGSMDFDLGESIGWCACHAADCMARYFAGQDVYNDSGFAMYFITTENVENYINPETGEASYAYDGVQEIYLTGYSELWGVDLTGVFDGIE
ncbi:MAG: substrate-binding domain-containing protein [Clostridiales bacterium]|nr:substrate-binding domain-containing protein [Clostridiales bacterium]